ncbi:MAG: hypothetical protein RIQ75_2075 [Pseudomonadota bacterium]|jgi:CspA family cold shock protein
MPVGTVKFFNTDKGYGFISPDDGATDSFVHISAVERAGMRTLLKDQRVKYELETDQRGKTSAVNLEAA